MRPTWAEIDLNSLKFNFNQVKRIVGSNVCVLSVVKADAYGHGSIAVSRALVEAGTDMLGVATVEEAIELRESGIKVPIVLLGGVQPEEAELVVRYALTPSIFSLSSAEAINRYAYRVGKKVRFHLKVDTGMNRLGLSVDEVCCFLNCLTSLRNLELEGVFTHFASADSNSRDFTLKQISSFKLVIYTLKKAGLSPRYMHMANSAGIQRFPESHMNLVRPGIMLYGSGKLGQWELKPVMKLKTRVVQLKSLPVGSPVSYGGTFVTKRPTLIATLPIGYGDGYMRRLSNRAFVSLKGFRVPVIGSVCMDMTIVDVTDVPDVRVGDEVVLFGDDGIKVEDIAMWADTISYEILSIIGKRIPRIYV